MRIFQVLFQHINIIKPVGFIVYDDENKEWEYFDDITIDCSYKCNENLSALLKAIMSSNYADSFKLLDFK